MKRRDVLKMSALVLTGAVGAEFVKALNLEKYDANQHYYVFVVDVTKCIGCGRCVKACKVENDVPDNHYRTWVERYTWLENGELKIESPEGGFNGFPPLKDENVIKSYFVPKLCNQCENPPCVQVCPVGATFKTPDGVVLVDPKYCIGCRYCMIACPYNARRFLYDHPEENLRVVNPEAPIRKHGVVMKCEFCLWKIDRERAEGKDPKPVCVEACPHKALIFGNLKDPNSEISKILRTSKVITLRAHLGTNPKVKYKL